jgi:hypothetical protein
MNDQSANHEFDDMSDDYLMSFVTDSTGTYVAVHLDLQGVTILIKELEGIKKVLERNDICPHSHLLASIGAPDGLTATKIASQKNEVNIVDHVKIYGWTEERAKEHGLKPQKE